MRFVHCVQPPLAHYTHNTSTARCRCESALHGPDVPPNLCAQDAEDRAADLARQLEDMRLEKVSFPGTTAHVHSECDPVRLSPRPNLLGGHCTHFIRLLRQLCTCHWFRGRFEHNR